MRYEVDITISLRHLMAIEANSPEDANAKATDLMQKRPADEMSFVSKIEKSADLGKRGR